MLLWRKFSTLSACLQHIIPPVYNPEAIEHFMQIALREAKAAFDEGEVPVGAVVVFDNRVIGRGHNRVEALHDATAHAELIALTAAYEHFGDWRLDGCLLVSTLEPCTMCAGASVHSRIGRIVYGAKDPKFGGCGSIFSIPTDLRLNHRCELIGGVLEAEVSELMRAFFKRVRADKQQLH